MAGISYLLCLLIAVFTIVTADYCNMQSCSEKGSHTMCQYSSKPAAACGDSYSIGLSDVEKKTVLDKHNELRRKVASGEEGRGKPGPQPAAVSMPDLTWDDELAEIAQRWTNQCKFEHDKCRNVDRWSWVGQNGAASWGKSTHSVDDLVQSWYDEVVDFDSRTVEKYEFDYNTGHYSQVVWAETTKVGCGMILFKDSNDRNTKHLFCNYGPGGNYNGEKVYEIKK